MNIVDNYVIVTWSTWYFWAQLCLDLLSANYWVIWVYKSELQREILLSYLYSQLKKEFIDERMQFIKLDFSWEDAEKQAKWLFSGDRNIIWLINNAWVDNQDAIEEVSLSDIKDIFLVNVFIPMIISKEFLIYIHRHKIQNARCIINISSLLAQFWDLKSSLYWASKWALESFGRNLAIETANEGLRVISVEINWLPNKLYLPWDADMRQYDSKDIKKWNSIYYDFNKIPIQLDSSDYGKFTQPILSLMDNSWRYCTWITIAIDGWVSIKR